MSMHHGRVESDPGPASSPELTDALSAPSDALVHALAPFGGDIIFLGADGKCGIQLVVGPSTKIFRRSGVRATTADLQVGVAISAGVDDKFTFPFCRPPGGAKAIVIEQ